MLSGFRFGKDVVLQVIVHVQSFSRGAAEVQQRFSRGAELQRCRGTEAHQRCRGGAEVQIFRGAEVQRCSFAVAEVLRLRC